MRKNLDIPQGKRTPLYRFLEILPGAVSYGAIILLFVLSLINPILGSIYLFIIIATTLVKAISTAYRTVQGFEVMKRAGRVDWHGRMEDLQNPHDAYERLLDDNNKSYHFYEHLENLKMMAAMPEQYPKPSDIYHVAIIAAYDESEEVLVPSIEAIKDSTFSNDHIIVALAYEARGGEAMENTAQILYQKYRGVFKDFILSKHPSDLKGEIVGKGPNLTFAGKIIADYIPGENWSAFDEITRKVLDLDDSFRKDKDLGQMNAGVTIIVITWKN